MARFAIDKMMTINDHRFHYRDWNGHGWPMLLLHGLASTSHFWDLVAPQLEGVRVAAMDIRGHGQSDKPDSAYTFEEVAGDVYALMKELQLESPVLVGHSYGANVSLWLAAHYPDEIAGVVMVDGGLTELGKLMTWEETRNLLKPPPLDGMPVEKFRELITKNTPEGLLTPEVETAILANFEIDNEDRIYRRLPVEYHLRILRSMWETSTTELLDKVSCPVLIIMARWPDRDDPTRLEIKTQAVAAAEKRLADSQVIWFDETIHDIPLQRPKQLAKAINTFIQQEI